MINITNQSNIHIKFNQNFEKPIPNNESTSHFKDRFNSLPIELKIMIFYNLTENYKNKKPDTILYLTAFPPSTSLIEQYTEIEKWPLKIQQEILNACHPLRDNIIKKSQYLLRHTDKTDEAARLLLKTLPSLRDENAIIFALESLSECLQKTKNRLLLEKILEEISQNSQNWSGELQKKVFHLMEEYTSKISDVCLIKILESIPFFFAELSNFQPENKQKYSSMKPLSLTDEASNFTLNELTKLFEKYNNKEQSHDIAFALINFIENWNDLDDPTVLISFDLICNYLDFHNEGNNLKEFWSALLITTVKNIKNLPRIDPWKTTMKEWLNTSMNLLQQRKFSNGHHHSLLNFFVENVDLLNDSQINILNSLHPS